MTFSCKRCAYQWDAQKKDAPKDFVPKQCPHCKSTLWNKDYVRGPKKKIQVVTLDDYVNVLDTQEMNDTIKEMSEYAAKHLAAEMDVICDPKPGMSYSDQVRLAMEKLK